MDIFYTDVTVLDPYGDRILENGIGNSDNKGNYWFEKFKVNDFPKSGKEYIISATRKDTNLPVQLTLTCVKGNTTSSFK